MENVTRAAANECLKCSSFKALLIDPKEFDSGSRF